MKTVYTYYEPIETMNNCSRRRYQQEDLIKICSRSWQRYGWNFVTLNYNHARSHPFYHEYSEIIKKLPSINPESYDYHCFMRWLAMSGVGGGLMIDYDVINNSLHTDSIFLKQMRMTCFQNHVPCTVYGSSYEYYKICQTFCSLSNTEKCKVSINNKPHTSDMIMIAYGITNDNLNQIDYVVDYPKIGSLVHCSERFCSENKKSKMDAMIEIINME